MSNEEHSQATEPSNVTQGSATAPAGGDSEVSKLALIEARLANEKKSTVVAYLLWFFFGGFGFHDFYLRKSMAGIGHLVLALFVFLGMFIPIIAMIAGGALFVWQVVDLFLIPSYIRAVTDADRLKMQSGLLK